MERRGKLSRGKLSQDKLSRGKLSPPNTVYYTGYWILQRMLDIILDITPDTG